MTKIEFPEKYGVLNQTGRKLLVFLRHSGCPFCRQTLSDLQQSRPEIEQNGTEIVLVHMMNAPDEARDFFARYDLHDVQAIADPDQELYARLGIERGSASQFLGPRVWLKGALCTLVEGHLPGRPQGDISQLSGVVLIEDGVVLRKHLGTTSADRPDYVALSQSASNKD
jgi:hypothetical protein